MWSECAGALRRQQLIQFTLVLERPHFIETADGLLIDKNLRNGSSSRRLQKPGALVVILRNVNLNKWDSFASEKGLSSRAGSTDFRRVDYYGGHKPKLDCEVRNLQACFGKNIFSVVKA